MFILLRIIHILSGVFWAGSVFFLVSFLLPTLGAVGPAGGPVQAELNRRGLFQKLPIVALVAILSGFWMYYIRMQGLSIGNPPTELKVLGAGGASALIAFIVGVTMVKPRQDRAGAIMAAVATMGPGAEKDAKMAEVGKIRGQLGMFARVVASLVGITVITMAIARYV